MKSKLTIVALAAALAVPCVVRAQTTVGASLTSLYGVTKTNVMASAELLDEPLYAFRPTDEVRSMGELFGHVAFDSYVFCSAAAGESNPNAENFEETRTSKASLIEALEMGFAYCDRVYANTTEEMGARPVSFMGPSTAFGVLAFNAAHNYEHYGNLVTYMRLNGIVPPSSR